MFDDFLGSMEQQKDALEKKLSETEVVKKSANNEIEVVVNGHKKVLDITINKNFEDNSELEDLLVLTLNSAVEEAGRISDKETENIFNSLMPGGLDGLKGMFG